MSSKGRLPIGTRVLINNIPEICKFDPPVIGIIVDIVKDHGKYSYTARVPARPFRSISYDKKHDWWYIGNEDIVGAFYPTYEEGEK